MYELFFSPENSRKYVRHLRIPCLTLKHAVVAGPLIANRKEFEPVSPGEFGMCEDVMQHVYRLLRKKP